MDGVFFGKDFLGPYYSYASLVGGGMTNLGGFKGMDGTSALYMILFFGTGGGTGTHGHCGKIRPQKQTG